MMCYSKKAFLLFIFTLICSCWPREIEETVNLIINNGLDNRVDMMFFGDGLPSGKKSITKLGKGEIFNDGDTQTEVLIYEISQANPLYLFLIRSELKYTIYLPMSLLGIVCLILVRAKEKETPIPIPTQ